MVAPQKPVVSTLKLHLPDVSKMLRKNKVFLMTTELICTKN